MHLHHALAPPKTTSSNRTVPLADPTLEALSPHLAHFPRSPGDLVLLDPHAQPVSSSRFVPQWRQAAKAAGAPKLRYHDLRHTYASTLLSGGANVKAVSGYLGHASPVVTLNTYAHLMPADDDITRRMLAAAFARADQATPADQARTS